MSVETKQTTVDKSGDFSRSAIPADQRQSSVSIFVTTAGWVICLSTILAGGVLVGGMDLGKASIAAIVGMLILALIAAPIAGIGGRHGVPTAMIAKSALGSKGALIFIAIVAFMNGIGWFAYQAAFMAMAVKELFPNTIFGNLAVGSTIGGIIMTILAIFGFKGVTILCFIAVPMIVSLSFFGGIAAIEVSGGMSELMKISSAATGMTMGAGITAVVGGAIMGCMMLSDIARFGKNEKVGSISASLGYMIGGVFCIVAGALMAVAANVDSIGTTPNLPKVMAALGLGAGALVVLVLAQLTTNTTNVYSAAVSIGSWVNIKQRYIVLILGAAGTALAVFDIYAYFIPILNFIGTAVPPVAGVIIADYWIITRAVKKSDYSFEEGKYYGEFNWLGWAVAIVSAVIASKINFFATSFNSLVIGFILYTILALICNTCNVSYMIKVKNTNVEEIKEA